MIIKPIKPNYKIPFIISSFICTMLVLIYELNIVNQYNARINVLKDYYTTKNPYSEVFSVFALWFGSDSSSSYVSIVTYIFPFLSLLSCSWVYSYELKKGIFQSSNLSVDDRKYIYGSCAKVFIVSGATIAIPLSVNFMTTSLFVPAIYPDSVYDIYYGIFSNSFLGTVFYASPFVYIFIFIILNYVFYGLLGCFCLCLSFHIKWILSAIITLLGWFGLHFSEHLVQNIPAEYSPVKFLIPAKSGYTNWVVIVGEAGVMFVFVLIFVSTNYRRFQCSLFR